MSLKIFLFSAIVANFIRFWDRASKLQKNEYPRVAKQTAFGDAVDMALCVGYFIWVCLLLRSIL